MLELYQKQNHVIYPYTWLYMTVDYYINAFKLAVELINLYCSCFFSFVNVIPPSYTLKMDTYHRM